MFSALVVAAMLGQMASPVVAAPAAAPAPVVVSQRVVPIDAPAQLARMQHKNVLGFELGYNGLAGLGAVYTRHLHPNISLDGSVGLALRGAQLGVRGRYNILRRNLTPFVGLGFMYASGARGLSQMEFGVGGTVRPTRFHIRPAPLLQATGGLAYQASRGLAIVASAGWTQLLGGSNVAVDSDSPASFVRQNYAPAVGSGPTVALNLGYSF